MNLKMRYIWLMLRGKPGWGVAFSLLILLVVEAWLHTDDFLYQYRSVFAAGRVMSKVNYIESAIPEIIIAGNSRVDNGFDPKILMNELQTNLQAFNLGIPGANAQTLYGIFKRFADNNLLGESKIEFVILGLDETFFHKEDSLGYSVFFADRAAMSEFGEYKLLMGSLFRLWGYSSNLKGLREPAKAQKFLEASFADIHPWGGSTSVNYGHRTAENNEFQNITQITLQEAGSKNPPDALIENYFWRLIDLLVENKVEIGIVFPPLLNRDVLFLTPGDPLAANYQSILHELQSRKIKIFHLNDGVVKRPEEFANAGHLNQLGASKYTRFLANEIKNNWPEVVHK